MGKVEKLEAEAGIQQKGYTACTASPFCRWPGRMKLGDRYVCIEHYATDPRRWENSTEENNAY